VHLVVSSRGEPVEFSLAAASEADVKLLKELGLDLPEGSIICADKGYTDYHYEDLLKEAGGLHLKAQRKKRSKRPMPAWEEFLGKPIRQYIETVFSKLSGLFSRKIHAVTPRGFRVEDCLLPAGLLHSMFIGGSLGYLLVKASGERVSGGRQELLVALDRRAREFNAQVVMFSQALAGRLGINPTDLQCLNVLAQTGPITAGRLAEITGLTVGAITGIVDRLERAGYVRRERDTKDRRRVIVHPISGSSELNLAPLFEDVREAPAELYSDYTDEELALILRFLREGRSDPPGTDHQAEGTSNRPLGPQGLDSPARATAPAGRSFGEPCTESDRLNNPSTHGCHSIGGERSFVAFL
jgi:DNA-binding MarR family transcriptional regulator